MYYEYHFFLTTSMMPFVISVSKKITAISKTHFQDFSQRNPRDENGGIHPVLRGLETWPRLKAQQTSTSEAAFQVTLREWEIDLNRAILWNLHHKKSDKKKQQKAGRNSETWYHSPTKQTLTDKANHRSAFAKTQV